MSSILVTRPAGDIDPLAVALRARGHAVIGIPTIAVLPVPGVAWPRIDSFDWAVVTSAAGVATLPESLAGPRWAVVGHVTADALRARGVAPAFMPDAADAATLAATLPVLPAERVLLVLGSLAGSDIARVLMQRGAHVEQITTYVTVEGPASSSVSLRAAVEDASTRLVVFASPSAVRGYLKLGGRVDLPAVCIGPRTSAAAHDAGMRVAAEADGRESLLLVEAVERALQSPGAE